MSLLEILALPVVAFLAFFLKGIVGIGVGIVSIPLLSLIFGAKEVVVLASMVNVIGSLVMYRIDPQPASRRFWWPIAALMIMGAVFGGIALKLTPLKSFEKILGMAILAAGIWFIIWRGKQELMLIGPRDKAWDMVFIVRYPTAGAFLEMVTDPGYQSAVQHRRAALLDSRLIRMTELAGGESFSL